MTRTKLPPGPPSPGILGPLPGLLWGSAYALGGEAVLEQALRHYAPAMTLRLPGFGRVVVLSDPALVRQVFTAPTDVLLGGEGVGASATIYGSSSMFVLDEPEHLRRRKLLTPPLHGAALASYRPLIVQRTEAALPSLEGDQPVNLLEWSRSLTLDVITEVMFGATDPAELHRRGKPFEALLELGLSEEVTLRYLLRGLGADRHWPRRDRAWRAIDDVVLPLIAERRDDALLAERTDILSLLLQARAEDGTALTDREIRDDLITLMLAGHETTATTVAWAMECLLRSPSAHAAAVSEARDSDATTYLEAVVNETLRLHPPVPFTGRVTAGHYELGEWVLPPGTMIAPHIGVLNRDRAAYPDPDAFRPERFLDQRPNLHAWIPFGGGVKRCLGASFSMLELTTMLQVLLRSGDLEAARSQPERAVRRSVVVVPRRGVPVRFHQRSLEVSA